MPATKRDPWGWPRISSSLFFCFGPGPNKLRVMPNPCSANPQNWSSTKWLLPPFGTEINSLDITRNGGRRLSGQNLWVRWMTSFLWGKCAQFVSQFFGKYWANLICKPWNGPQIDQNWTQKGPKRDQKWVRNGSNMDKKWINDRPKIDQKWTKNTSKLEQKIDLQTLDLFLKHQVKVSMI